MIIIPHLGKTYMHGMIESHRATPMAAKMAIEYTLSLVCCSFIRRLDELTKPKKPKAPPVSRNAKAQLASARKRADRLALIQSQAVERSINVDSFAGFLALHAEYDGVESSPLYIAASEALEVVRKLKSLERLTIAYPHEVIARVAKLEKMVSQ